MAGFELGGARPNPKQFEFFKSTARFTAYGGARGGGKAQPLDEPVLTPFGFRRMGDINVGSIVCNPDGGTSRVIQIHPQGIRTIYRVTFIDGASTRCTGDHLWIAAKTMTDIGEKIYTTEQLKTIVEADAKTNVVVPLCEPVTFTRPTRSDVPVKPYTMGVLIGDGCLVGKTASFVSADEQIVNGVIADGYKTSEWNSDNCAAKTYGMIEFMPQYQKLQEIGLCVKSHEKFIPTVYKYLPIEERLSLIQGLMDTDGYVDSRGHCSYSTTSRELADDMAWLIRSIGGKATITDSIGKYKKDGEIIECKTVYDVYIQTKKNSQLFRLDRKKERCRDEFNGGVSELRRRIVSIEPCGEAECQCITVDNPNGLYITKDFIVTHNSWAMRRKFVLLATTHVGLKLLLLRRTLSELENNHIRPLQSELSRIPGVKYNGDKKYFLFPNGSIIQLGYCAAEGDVYQYQGQEYDVIGFEEATQFTEFQMDFIKTCNRTIRTDFKPRIYYTCNPGGVGHDYIKRLFIDRDYRNGENPDDYKFIKATVYDNYVLMQANPEYVSNLESLPDHLRRAFLNGDWDVVEGQYFREFSREKHVVDPFPLPIAWKRFRSIDIGFNDPTCVLWYAVAPDRRIYVYREIYQVPSSVVELAKLIKQYDGKDVISYTVGSVDMWNKHGLKDAFGGECVAETLSKLKVPVTKADNNRLNGWARIRESLLDAPDGKPYLQIFSNCSNLVRTLPVLFYDQHDHEDVSANCEDHAAESLRYGLMSRPSPSRDKPNAEQAAYQYNPLNPAPKRRESGFLNL